MTLPVPRRGFLRGLTTLPLIGRSVALIGSPTAVAEPVTTDLLDSSDAWLDTERRFLKWERYKSLTCDEFSPDIQCVWYDPVRRETFDYVPVANAGGRFHNSDDPHTQQPSTRAAPVLSTVGVNWREGRPCA